jgi:aldehyde dehydrogenase (NAD+)
MKIINQIYINGAFVTPVGTETFELVNPSDNETIGQVRLANEEDTSRAIAAAKTAFRTFSKSSKEERIEYLNRLHHAVLAREEDLVNVMIVEYGGTLQFCGRSVRNAITAFPNLIETPRKLELERPIGDTRLRLEPAGRCRHYYIGNQGSH